MEPNKAGQIVATPLFLDMQSEIMPIVDMLIDKEAPQWGAREHVSLVVRTALRANEACIEHEIEGDDARIFICRSLDQHGIAGNASQFRQWLQSKQGGERLPKETAKAKALYK